jgi:hypothetical protein
MNYIYIEQPIYPDRKDLIYREMDAFEDHEISNCFAYELAIRNLDIQKELQLYENYLEKVKKAQPYNSKSDTEEIDNFNINKLLNYGFNIDALDYYIFIKAAKNDSRLKKYSSNELCEFFESKLSRINNQYENILSLYKHKLFKKGYYTETISCKFIERKDGTIEFIHIINDGLHTGKTTNSSDNPTPLLTHEKFKTTVMPSLSISMSRPLMKNNNPDQHARFNIEVNMQSSEEEIVAYIRAVKASYNLQQAESNKLQQDIDEVKSSFLNEIYDDDSLEIKKKKKKHNSLVNMMGTFAYSHNKIGIESISELLYQAFEPEKKHSKLRTKKIKQQLTDALFIYDSMKIYENFELELQNKYDKALKTINAETFHSDGSDREVARISLKQEMNEYTQENKSKFQKNLYKKIRPKKPLPKDRYPIKDTYTIAKNLIEKEKYKTFFQ